MELEVLDPWEHENYGSQPLRSCIDHTENHNSPAPAFRFDTGGKGAYGQWWDMVDVVGRWMRVGGRGRWKMEDDDGGQGGHPTEFSISKSNKIDIFLNIRRN